MKKTYVTTMPDRVGAFLRASKCISAYGLNITRVNYNQSVDAHTLFIEVEGTEAQLAQADHALTLIGYLQNTRRNTSIALLEFSLKDVPGKVTDVLSLVYRFQFNISYISSQENGSDYQLLKLGLYVEDQDKLTEFLSAAEALCPVRLLDYNSAEKVFDNRIFYNSYVTGLARTMALSEDVKPKLLVYVNLAMQMLDEQGASPYRTFDSISKFADLLAACRGENFSPRITHHPITENTNLILIEPPCGSNTAILTSGSEVLFIDCGYACYEPEMLKLFRRLVPDFDSRRKTVLITHADLDHCGLLHLFDEVLTTRRSALCLNREYRGEKGYREYLPMHAPYINICKILTSYRPLNPDILKVMWDSPEEMTQPLTKIGDFRFGDLNFSVLEGQGGHLPGEIILLDYEHRIAFTGDVYINMRGLTPQQAEHNKYAPILMTSVDTDPKLCAAERTAIMEALTPGQWQIFGAHGYKKELTVEP